MEIFREGEDFMKNKSILGSLFLTMFKIGLFTFGGGYAMIAVLENELVERKAWINREEFLDMAAIAESTPGPVAVNSATYVGYRLAGVIGAAVATVGVCLPSFLVIYLISLFFDAFLSLTYVSYAFLGIRVGVIWLILSAGVKMFLQTKKTVFNLVVLATVAMGMSIFSFFAVHFSTVFWILLAGTAGVAIWGIRRIGGRKK